MKIQGESRPITHNKYQYRLLDNQNRAIKVDSWQVEQGGKVLSTNNSGSFSFSLTLANTSVRLTAVVTSGGRKNYHSISLAVLAGKPKITLVQWQDYNNQPIGARKVGYLDKIQLCIRTINIPRGDTLRVSLYEDDYTGDRKLGTYTTSPVNANGYAYLYFKQLSLYQTNLNRRDAINESEHEFYVEVEYRNYLDEAFERTQLVIQNQLTQIIDLPKPANKPVKIANIGPPKRANQRDGVDVTFNMFFDGTLNNMTNTRARLEKDNRGSNLAGVFNRRSNKKDDSYMNYYSNVALLFMNNTISEESDILNIYTEGIGTVNKGGDQTSAAGLGTSIDIPITPLISVSVFRTGIKDKVNRGIGQMGVAAQRKYFSKDKNIRKVTINVFGFSRGAAAARYFMSKEREITSVLNLEDRKDIKFNFIGLFDTVASYGIVHINDVSDLKLDIGGKAKKVIQLAAADEYRDNFKLTDITSCIAAGVGYQLTLPGVHSDIGGGYGEWEIEERFLGTETTFRESDVPLELHKLKQYYINEGWYKPHQLRITKETKSHFSKLETHTFQYKHTLNGIRNESFGKNKVGLPNTYQYIPFAIMKKFCEVYAKMEFKKNTDIIYAVNEKLAPIKKQLYDYAISHDSVRAHSIVLSRQDQMWVRNEYLHRSNKDDQALTMAGRYVKGKPERDILHG